MIHTREQVLEYALSFADTYQDAPFHDENWQLVRYKENKKAFLWTYHRNGYININVKVEPEQAFVWRDIYQSVLPGYHQNKMHWNTIILDGTVLDSDIKLMIKDSYNLIATTASKKIYEAVKKIPCGTVATYAQIAKIAGNEKMSRAVGNALHKNPAPNTIPCHRVVNAQGKLTENFAFGGIQAQGELLKKEGVQVINGRVDLQLYQWKSQKYEEN